MIPANIKIPVPFEYVFPSGAMCLGVEAETDFDKRGQADDQKRDEHGKRVWVVKVMDLDPDAGKFGRSTEVKVKIAADHQPVPPSAKVPGYPPLVAFTDVTVTPYTDVQKCTGNHRPGQSHKCRARQGWSIRASAVIDPAELAKADKPAKSA